MKVSAIVCTYKMDRYAAFTKAVESVLSQSYEPLEVVLVIDGNPEVAERARNDFENRDNIIIHNNETNRGISYSRTKGAKIASGRIVVMIDDDAVAEPNWIAELVSVYESTDAVAVGGRVAPNWVSGKPPFFPEEFYWLVGCDERGFGEHMEEVRNTYGSNISYKRDVFLEVGGYDENTGRKGDRHIQAHEAPVCVRIRKQTGKGVVYTTDAVVHHTLFDYRGEFRWLLLRSFWQGYSKRIMDLTLPEASGDKNEYLAQLLLVFVPQRIRALIRNPSTAKVKQLGAIFLFTVAVGFGYLYGMTKRELSNEDGSELSTA